MAMTIPQRSGGPPYNDTRLKTGPPSATGDDEQYPDRYKTHAKRVTVIMMSDSEGDDENPITETAPFILHDGQHDRSITIEEDDEDSITQAPPIILDDGQHDRPITIIGTYVERDETFLLTYAELPRTIAERIEAFLKRARRESPHWRHKWFPYSCTSLRLQGKTSFKWSVENPSNMPNMCEHATAVLTLETWSTQHARGHRSSGGSTRGQNGIRGGVLGARRSRREEDLKGIMEVRMYRAYWCIGGK